MADECFSGHMLRALRKAGFDIVRSAQFLPAGDDAAVLALAFLQGRILLTEDKDFGKLAITLEVQAFGVVRVVLKSVDRETRKKRIVDTLSELGDGAINAMVVVEPGRTRIRSLSSSIKD